MKKSFLITLALLTLLSLAACNNTTPANTSDTTQETELTVFAAASMSGVLLEIADIYTADTPHTNVIFNFDSSGTLRTQIQEGANADLFISAATREMDQLEESDLLQTDTRVNFLENQTVLVAAPDNPKAIESFENMVDALLAGDILMAMGNMDVPVGRYAREILTYFGLDHETLARTGVISYGSNVREVATQVREASVDIGIVYLTDAVDFDLTVVDIATPEMAGRVIYPAAILRDSQNTEAAQSFLDFMVGDTAMAVFTDWGFTPFR
ncbi:MAG: molybdate ABC transporter substrate-binding protein [Oscillospiraceae bacterium]|nr:molybdate ABC transporter substrate-binding protein [Oscillospiraceae bacterium]